MVKIYYRVSFRGTLRIARRQKNPVIPVLPENYAVMPGINNGDIIRLGEGCATNQYE
jgi:hypothetical protein